MSRIRIVNFHGVGSPPRVLEPGEERVWLTVDEVTLVLDLIAGRPDVAITVDDGNRSDIEFLLPELRRRGLAATFFVVAGRMGDDHFVHWDDLSALREAGMRIGSHGMHHRSWRGLSAVALHEEVVQAKLVLEAGTGRPVDEAALPFGDYGRRVLLAARHAGYRRVYTSDGGTADPGRWLQPRISLTSGLTDEELRTLLRPPTAGRRALMQSKRLAKSLR
jgi:peptidoglycan/xylan/chitin deacetylase (PgdA/CDA1 family)